jgi:hypothetical protein
LFSSPCLSRLSPISPDTWFSFPIIYKLHHLLSLSTSSFQLGYLSPCGPRISFSIHSTSARLHSPLPKTVQPLLTRP